MRFQVRTLQVPKRGGGAFLPALTQIPTAATNGANQVYGSPGVAPVYSPRPAALADGELGGPLNQPSSVAPNYIFPSIYVALVNAGLRFPGRLICDNVLPVPAVSSVGIPAQTQYKPRIGGRTATAAFRPFTQWPTYSPGVRQ